MRFVHSLARFENAKKRGWCAPVELQEGTPQYVSFVIPIGNEKLDDRYACEVVKISQADRTVRALDLVKNGRDSFVLDIGKTKLWFTIRPVEKKDRYLPYVGKLVHPDFVSLFTEIEPADPAILDQLFEDQNLIVVGCDPGSHYRRSKKKRQVQRHA